MIDRAFIKKKYDTLLAVDHSTNAWGWDITLICPDMKGVKKQYPIVALVERFKDEALAGQTIYNDESRIVKIFLKDIELLRQGGAQIPSDSLKKVNATLKIDGVEMSIKYESFVANKRCFILKCNRLT